MKIFTEGPVLHLVDSNRSVAWVLLAAGGLCLGRLVYGLVNHASVPGEVGGLSFAVGLFLLGGIMFGRKGDFQFDTYARKLIWRRGGLFGQKGGAVPFEDIVEVRVESTRIGAGDGNVMGYRLVLRLQGAEPPVPPKIPMDGPVCQFHTTWGAPKGILPVSEAFTAGTQKNCEEFAARIREVLANPRR